MGKLTTIVLAILAVFNLSEAKLESCKVPEPPLPKLAVFKRGRFPTTVIDLKKSSPSSPPTPLKIHTPNTPSPYNLPALLFLHGSCLQNSYYTFLLQRIASHGYIVIAPQLYNCDIFIGPMSGEKEIEIAAKVANWLPENLDSVLPTKDKANLKQLAIGGHGRGGKTAFAMALGRSPLPLSVQFAALIGLDPVAGPTNHNEENPKILTYVPKSFDLKIPVTIIGNELSNQSNWCLTCPVCAPNGVSHVEFYKESKARVSHVVVRGYGHVDFLDDDLEGFVGWVASVRCKNGEGPKEILRKTIAGHIVAFLNAYLREHDLDYITILHRPAVTPVTIDPPEFNLDDVPVFKFKRFVY